MEYSETVPIQYEQGVAKFMGLDMAVDPRVLIPRPETELLVKITAKLCLRTGYERPLVLDVGTGSGNISIALGKMLGDCDIISVDISLKALMAAEANIKKFGMTKDITLKRSDMFEIFEEETEAIFDAIVSNPPYVSKRDYEKVDAWVKAEPKVALYGGRDGLDHIRVLARESGKYLKQGGFLALEIGYNQSAKVKDLLTAAGFKDVKGFKDFNNYERVIVGWKQ